MRKERKGEGSNSEKREKWKPTCSYRADRWERGDPCREQKREQRKEWRRADHYTNSRLEMTASRAQINETGEEVTL